QADQGALSLEPTRDALLQRLERVLLDLDLEALEQIPGAHRPPSPSSLATSSSSRSSSSALPTASSSAAHTSISALPSLTSASVSLRLASPESRRRMISSTLA